jgi:hypothetical protein
MILYLGHTICDCFGLSGCLYIACFINYFMTYQLCRLHCIRCLYECHRQISTNAISFHYTTQQTFPPQLQLLVSKQLITTNLHSGDVSNYYQQLLNILHVPNSRSESEMDHSHVSIILTPVTNLPFDVC